MPVSQLLCAQNRRAARSIAPGPLVSQNFFHEDGEMRTKIGGCSRPLRLDAGNAQDVPYRGIWRRRSRVARVGMPLTRGGDRRTIYSDMCFSLVPCCYALCCVHVHPTQACARCRNTVWIDLQFDPAPLRPFGFGP